MTVNLKKDAKNGLGKLFFIPPPAVSLSISLLLSLARLELEVACAI